MTDRALASRGRGVAKAVVATLGLTDVARRGQRPLLNAYWRMVNAVSMQLFKGMAVCRAGDLPTPPPSLIEAVTGYRDVRWYAETGAMAHRDITALLLRNKLTIDSFERVLDFGCGSGRVIRYWKNAQAEVHGCDASDGSIAWCRRHLPFPFEVNGFDPPLPYPDGHFDLLYAFSVFTHLDAGQQVRWRDEFARVLRPGALAIVTTHGTRWLDLLDGDGRRQFEADELVVLDHGEVGSNAFGTFQSEANVRKMFDGRLEVVDFAPWGALGVMGQDMYLVRRPVSS